MTDATVSFGVDSSKASASLKQLAMDFEKVEDSAGEAGRKVDELNDELNETSESGKRAKPAVEGAGKAIEEAGRKADTAEKKLDKLTDEIEENTLEVNENRRAVDRHGDELDDNSRDTERNTQATDKNTGAKRRNKSANKEAAIAADQAGNRMRKSSAGFGVMTGRIAGATAAVYAMNRAFSLTFSPAMNFEQAMANVQAVIGGTTEDMELLSEAIKNAGKGLNLTGTQIANAQLFLAMAGLNPEQIAGALRPALVMSIAGDLSAGQTADFLTNIAGGFGYGVDQYQRVADVSSFTSTSANTDITQLASALTNVAGGAASAGLELEDASAALGIFANRGIQGGRAGVMLRQMLVNLVKPTGEAKKVLDELGVSLEEIDTQEVGLIGAMEKLKEAGITRQQILRLFDTRVTEGVFALLGDFEEWERLSGDIKENAEGAAESIADIKLGTLIGDMGKLAAATDTWMKNTTKNLGLMWAAGQVVGGLTEGFTTANQMFNEGGFANLLQGLPTDASQRDRDYLKAIKARDEQQKIVDEWEDKNERDNMALQRSKGEREEYRYYRRARNSGNQLHYARVELNRLQEEVDSFSEKIEEANKPAVVEAPPVVEDEELRLPPVEATTVDKIKELDKFYDKLGTDTEQFGFMLTDSFSGMYDNLLDKTKDFGDVLDEAFGQIFYNIGHDLFKKYIATPLSDALTEHIIPHLFGISFDGGGFTGSGPRTGGIDGKGGFPAILHRDEVVTDLRNPNSMEVTQTPNVTVIQNMDFRNADDETVAKLQQAIPMIAEAASVRVKQELASGGDLYRFTSGGR